MVDGVATLYIPTESRATLIRPQLMQLIGTLSKEYSRASLLVLKSNSLVDE